MAKVRGRTSKRKQPFWKTFKLANEENFIKLSRKKKPPCIEGREAHSFRLPSKPPPEGGKYLAGRCRFCTIRWLFKNVTEEDLRWKQSIGKKQNGSNSMEKSD